jgi:hypothetical protein
VRETKTNSDTQPDPFAPTRPPDAQEVKWRTPVSVWLKSEYLDSESYFRSGCGRDYEGASWPLGVKFVADPKLDQDLSVLIDGKFDAAVRRAFSLPWHYSKLRIAGPYRPSGANFVIRNIGHWRGEPWRFDELKAVLTDRTFEFGIGSVQHLYALTPFCIIAQRWLDDPVITLSNYAVDCYILLFYSFETFIQECLAFDAHQQCFPADRIIGAYQHVYAHALRPSDVISTDPRMLNLARLTSRELPWDDIVTTRGQGRLPNRSWGHPDARMRAQREALFERRMEAHLMVAIAAACCGLQAFAGRPSALVRTMEAPPTSEQLAPLWLRHVLGDYDHGTTLSPSHSGLQTPGIMEPRTEAELSIGNAASPLARRHQPEAFDRRRWQGLFETTIENHSVAQWRERLSQLD